MRSLPLLYLVILLSARGTTAYDPNQLVKGFLVIRNSTAARILIDQNDPLAGKSKNKKTNRNKLSLLGLGAYILSAVTVLIHGVLLLLEPLGDASYVIDTRLIHLQAGNLNEAIVLVSAFTVLLLMGAISFLNMTVLAIRRSKVRGRKLNIGISIFLSLSFLIGAVFFGIKMIGFLKLV